MARGKTIAALVLMLALTCGLGACAQEAQQPAQSSPEASGRQKNPAADQTTSEGKALVKEEEGEADPSAVFRHSWAVRAIARKTGLSIDQTFWLCMALNFIAVFVFLWVLARKALPEIFRNRTEAIQRRMQEARKTSEEARSRLAEVEARLSRLDTEIEQMQREAEASGRHEEERVTAAAEEERRRIVESAEQEIARAASAARRELKAYAAELAVDLAEKRIRIEATIDRELVREFTTSLGKDGNN